MKKLILLFGLTVAFLTGCSENVNNAQGAEPAPPLERTEILMNAPVEIRIFDVAEDSTLLDETFEILFDLERRWTVNDTGGEVALINEMAGIEPVEVAADTFYLIEQAVYYSLYSDSLFNVAIGPLTSLWNISLPGARRPDDSEIEAVLPLLDPALITLDAEASTVFLEKEGMRLDLGAIAQGFMADVANEFLVNNDVERGVIAVAGEVVTIGLRRDETPWQVGISNPWAETAKGDIVGTVPLSNRALVTSGTYNRYLAYQNTRTTYHHIFDSKTGFPLDTDIVSLTIIADTGLLAEVYTTMIFGMGLEEGMAYVEEKSGIEAIFIMQDGGIYVSSGLDDSFGFNEYLADEFEVR